MTSPAPQRPAEKIRDWWSRWLGSRPLAQPDDAVRAVRAALDAGVLDLPLPGAGATPDRWDGLAALGAADCALARLAEGHVDAVAILAEAGLRPLASGQLAAVWASEPPSARLLAERAGQEWRLSGPKAWCTGAGDVDVALVTAWDGDTQRLFRVDGRDPRLAVDTSVWKAVGMSGARTGQVTFTAAPAEPVGDAGWYTSRPGFWHGGAGVAAVWLGAANAVAAPLAVATARREVGAHTRAHLGAVEARVAAARALVSQAAAQTDAVPADTWAARVRARRVRSLVDLTVGEVLDRVARALGPAQMTGDGSHAQRVADLAVYVRQSHAEADLEALGADLVTPRPQPAPSVPEQADGPGDAASAGGAGGAGGAEGEG